MYTAYYGFHEKPFALSPDPKYLFLSSTHREVLGHLVYGIEQGEGFMAISGEVGTGKTTLCRTLLDRLGADCEIAFLFNPMLSPLELIKAINSEFDISRFGDSRPELLDVLNTFLLEKHDQGCRVLVIIDEAQNLPEETLEQLRLLSNLESRTAKLMQIILIGQPELDEKLSTRALRQLRQRISVWWGLGSLQRTETAEYVCHRLRIASGADRPIFTRAALAEIHRATRGVPRLINVLCDRSLLAGYGQRAAQIGPRTVRHVARELRLDRSPAWWPSLAIGGGLSIAATAVALLWWSDLRPFDRSAPETASPTATAPQAPALPSVAARPPDAIVPEPAAPTPVVHAASAGVLDGLFPLQDPRAANTGALAALLRAWGMPDDPHVATFGEVLADLEARGMRTIALASIDEMRAIDVPVLLHLTDGNGRAALLRSLGGDAADVEGIVPGQVVRLPLADLESRWEPPAYAAWRDYGRLPAMVVEGSSGPPVQWLQRSLARLGHYEGPQHGRFDSPTRSAVEWFQREHGLPVDGNFGPTTQVQLYRALPEYRMPALVLGAGPRTASVP